MNNQHKKQKSNSSAKANSSQQARNIQEIFSAADIERTLYRLTHQILEKTPQPENIVLLGIHTRGVYLAHRLQTMLEKIKGIHLPLGELDITFYRDDLTAIGYSPVVKETKIDFSIQDKIVILIDDVLFTGRTARAALDAIIDFGRPRAIRLLVLIDRGHRELPIKADFVGRNIPTAKKDSVELRVKELDGKDAVVILKR
jgi:pyrimidine operon attenuation protein/uracil phosphoribosyltransferase